MDSDLIVARLRRFLLLVAGLICLGTPVELWLADHLESPAQLIPFALCAAGALAVGAALWRPSRAALLALRGVMALLILGSLFGIYEHLEGNLAFAQEIRPNAAAAVVWLDALRGAAPLLAPGILALAGMLALAATYAHPLLARAAPAAGPIYRRS